MSFRALAARVSVVIVVVGILVGCGEFPFKPRENEEPSSSGAEWAAPVSPDIVVTNMVNAVGRREALLYAELLAEDFTFRPDPEDSIALEQTYPGIFADWDASVETKVMEYMLNPARCSFASLRFYDETIVEETDTTYVLDSKYEAIIRIGKFRKYEGQMRFTIKRHSDGFWYIHHLIDDRISSEKETWGKLKGEIRAMM